VVSAPFDFDDEFATPASYAAAYRRLGLQVVPSHHPSEGGQWKRPALLSWLEFQDTLVTDTVFARWYDPVGGEHRNRKNLGLVTGAASGGMFCIDLDTQKNLGAREWWIGLLAVHNNGLEIETPRQRTGGGGEQILFSAPTGWSPPTFKASAVGIDVRGQGGFMVAPPSMHTSGHSYEWLPGLAPWQVELAVAPDWLIEAIEQLRLEHGGQDRTTGQTGHVPSPDGTKGDFGFDIDDREHKLQVVVWGAVVDLYRESPIPAPEAAQEAEIARLWQQYEATTKTRLSGVPNAEGLEREGRGISELRRKWRYAMRHWDSKVKAAAAEPKPHQNPWGERLNEGFDRPAGDTSDTEDEPAGFRTFNSFVGEPPPRQWLVDDWVAEGVVNSLYGGGGTGKSLLAMQLGAARAGRQNWLNLTTKPGATLGIFCEDDEDELHRRMWQIREAMGYSIGWPFEAFQMATRVGEENRLVTLDRAGNAGAGPFYEKLVNKLEQLDPSLLILDTLADVYGANENAREQVNWFLKTMLSGLITHQKARGQILTVLLVGHPSLSGAQEGGRGYSGSGAWEAGVRSRLYLTKADPGGPDERTLTRGKANYSSAGDETAMRLTYEAGIFKAEGPPEDPTTAKIKKRVSDLVGWNWGMGKPFLEARGSPRNLFKALVPMLATELEVSRGQVSHGIRECIEEGQIFTSRNHAKRGWRTSDD
jgi:hypothetical protein